MVVIHDATLDRTTDASGRYGRPSLAALRPVRLKGTGGEILPTLAEAAALTREAGRVLRLEVKADVEGRPYPGTSRPASPCWMPPGCAAAPWR